MANCYPFGTPKYHVSIPKMPKDIYCCSALQREKEEKKSGFRVLKQVTIIVMSGFSCPIAAVVAVIIIDFGGLSQAFWIFTNLSSIADIIDNLHCHLSFLWKKKKKSHLKFV
jgi:hypothetical protein